MGFMGIKEFLNKYTIPLVIFICLVSIIGIYFIQYPVNTDKSSLEVELKKFGKSDDLKIEEIENIDNNIITLFTYDNVIGYGVFEKGINGKCRFIFKDSNMGDGSFQVGYIGASEKNNSFIVGKNYENKIKAMEFTYEDGSKFLMEITKENYFIQSTSNFKGISSLKEFDLLDEKGESIKAELRPKFMGHTVISSSSKSRSVVGPYDFLYGLIIVISYVIIYSRYKSMRRGDDVE